MKKSLVSMIFGAFLAFATVASSAAFAGGDAATYGGYAATSGGDAASDGGDALSNKNELKVGGVAVAPQLPSAQHYDVLLPPGCFRKSENPIIWSCPLEETRRGNDVFIGKANNVEFTRPVPLREEFLRNPALALERAKKARE